MAVFWNAGDVKKCCTMKIKNVKIITNFLLYCFKTLNWILTQFRHHLDQNSWQNYVYISSRFASGISVEFLSCGLLYFKEDYHDGNEFFFYKQNALKSILLLLLFILR